MLNAGYLNISNTFDESSNCDFLILFPTHNKPTHLNLMFAILSKKFHLGNRPQKQDTILYSLRFLNNLTGRCGNDFGVLPRGLSRSNVGDVKPFGELLHRDDTENPFLQYTRSD